ncbi:D-alanyl-D-alanine carboxypeptidase family protein [Enterovibrio nigricans]|uniref:serine-type D-Ala-D-Ala carboxypeptidase n=1 Tax=Enterovibrio nigricans DSM 22720 TaxID=1121868 RepID=A0A1T4W7Y2_9GAMM|nr:D-alanyl-D-alanine carboxypeptidase family protein [Enterovibrio nigricans]SKA73424.1 D-alanyl-D-alanine carboxypeptidase (penicillin-binding protein 5/6) [Enterovibrio nigricans DSM 22720]
MKRTAIFLLSLVTLLPAQAQIVKPNPPQIAAKGYVLMDFHSGMVIAEKDANEPLAPASLTKLMTAYVVGQEIELGRLAWDDKVDVSENAWSAKFPDSSKMFIKPGDIVTVQDLMRGLIVQSGNDASIALAEHIAGSESAFVDMMNNWAEKIGLDSTRFVNAHGLDADGIQSTALDMAVLMQSIIQDLPDVYALYSEKVFTWADITQYNRNKLLWDRSLDVDGGKTGYTSEAGYSLASSATQGRMRLVSVVMGTSSQQERESASKKLMNYGFRFYDSKQVAQRDALETQVKVWKGKTDEVALAYKEDIFLTLPRNQADSVAKSVVIDGSVVAPIEKGKILGRVEWRSNGEIVSTVPLVSAALIEETSWFGRVWDGIVLWFHSTWQSIV